MNNLLKDIKSKVQTYLRVVPPTPQNPHLAEKLQVVENRFKGALQFLKTMRLHTLPWYLLVGTAGSGKTSLLMHSGLKYMLEKKSSASEQCDWWVTPQAVLVDVPGNYFTYKAKMVSLPNKLWRHILTLIQETRGERALSGTIVTVSLAELMDKASRESLIDNLHYRLNEIRHKFGEAVPVYVAITKCDLLPGFTDFFSDYGSNEITQAWGVPLTLKEGESLPDVFSYWFNTLIKRLNQQLIWRLHQEKNIFSKLHIKDFPLQLERLKDAFAELLKGLVREGEPLLLRGVYLTSATQQPVNDTSSAHRQMILSGDLQTSLSIMQTPVMPTQAYFIKQFLMQVLSSDRPMKAVSSWRPRYMLYAFFISLLVMWLGGHSFN